MIRFLKEKIECNKERIAEWEDYKYIVHKNKGKFRIKYYGMNFHLEERFDLYKLGTIWRTVCISSNEKKHR